MSCKTNIICLLWKGDFRGRDYKDEDVRRLKQTVDKHIDRPYTLYCLTNDMKADIPAEKINLLNNFPGWWSKIELFRPDMPCGVNLYLDLDTHIVRSLQPILDYPVEDLVMFNSPYRKVGGKMYTKQGRLIVRYQAGTMLFKPGKLYWVYQKFVKSPDSYMKMYRSEQDVYGQWIPNQPTFPDKWMTKISKLKNNTINKDTIIVTGRPKGEDFRNPSFYKQLNTMAR